MKVMSFPGTVWVWLRKKGKAPKTVAKIQLNPTTAIASF
jgi:hypothetical protein